MSKKKVIVGMSGGVDSSVAALLLKQQGYEVIGMFMKNWEESDEGGACSAAADYEDVVQVCERLDILHYTINFSKDYWDRVFSSCLEDYAAGNTPNPDTLCNREIKFGVFFKKAMDMGADYLATGHYCRNVNNQLLRGVDQNKDQSYFLYTMKKKILERVLFPIGGLTKEEVRKIALENDLITAEKKDSTGICFIGKRKFKDFLSRYIKGEPGNFEDLGGNVVGKHDGVAYYTVGQRKGLGIGGPGEAWFVVGKDVDRNVVKVVQGEDHPALYNKSLIATEINVIGDTPLPTKCTAKIRYRQPDNECTIAKVKEGKVLVTFAELQKAITVHQAVVFYDGDVCLGGGVIDEIKQNLS